MYRREASGVIVAVATRGAMLGAAFVVPRATAKTMNAIAPRLTNQNRNRCVRCSMMCSLSPGSYAKRRLRSEAGNVCVVYRFGVAVGLPFLVGVRDLVTVACLVADGVLVSDGVNVCDGVNVIDGVNV